MTEVAGGAGEEGRGVPLCGEANAEMCFNVTKTPF